MEDIGLMLEDKLREAGFTDVTVDTWSKPFTVEMKIIVDGDTYRYSAPTERFDTDLVTDKVVREIVEENRIVTANGDIHLSITSHNGTSVRCLNCGREREMNIDVDVSSASTEVLSMLELYLTGIGQDHDCSKQLIAPATNNTL